ncbi:MAG: NAD(+) synthase [candidate division Zixibacteria bacterium]|nr:NAD(+) synthase [candidate division Zixibacteria bacterium]
MSFSTDSLNIDCEKVAAQLIKALQDQVYVRMKRGGAVVGTSGGIDSAVVAGLCSKAFGPDKMFGVLLPDKDSSPDSAELGKELADTFGYKITKEDMTEGLKGAGCYIRRDEAIARVFPDYKPGWKAKIVLPTNILEQNRFNVFRLTVTPPGGEPVTKRLPLKEYLQIVAASNMKQRIRMLTLYYHAEKLNYAVAGTGNKNEHEQGFFVKYGDGGADCKPIAHLFKTQVFQLAEYLGVPKSIRDRTPTTDTYPDEQTQEEFFFGLKFKIMDSIWYALENNIPADEVARALDLTAEQVERVWNDLEQKKRTTEYLRMEPLEIDSGK